MMNISVVIPNYNGEELLRKNLPKVFGVFKKYKNGAVEIVVADDSSKDTSLDFLNTFQKENKTNISLKILENNTGKNKGFASNVDIGVENAAGEIVILLNTDVVPDSDFLEPLLSHFSDETVFAVGCMDKSIEDGKIVLRGRGIGKWERGFMVHKAGSIDQTNTLWASCGSGAFRKSIWNKIGGLNELYNPFYWEDIDLSYKAQKAGYTVLFEPKSTVVHEHEKGSIKSQYKPFSVIKTAYRNQFFFTWLNATDTIIFIKHVVFLPYFLTRAIVKGDRAFLVGFFLALVSLPKVLVERGKVQKLVKKSDQEVVSAFV